MHSNVQRIMHTSVSMKFRMLKQIISNRSTLPAEQNDCISRAHTSMHFAHTCFSVKDLKLIKSGCSRLYKITLIKVNLNGT